MRIAVERASLAHGEVDLRVAASARIAAEAGAEPGGGIARRGGVTKIAAYTDLVLTFPLIDPVCCANIGTAHNSAIMPSRKKLKVASATRRRRLPFGVSSRFR